MHNKSIHALLSELHIEAPNILLSYRRAQEVERRIESVLSQELSQWVSLDTSLVVFGSLARREWTDKSDVDWTYLVDGQANSDHLTIAQRIKTILDREFKPPNVQGAFASLVFSHDLIHQIGGQEDTNRNTTQRMLLLLESVAIGDKAQEAYERVIKGVIGRYLEEGSGFLNADRTRYKVPRFLLNDIARFWRTMAVDFASKQRDRSGMGWGVRNFKLRMSRKLLFASGLLTCFGCYLDLQSANHGATPDELRAYLIRYLRMQFQMTPLEVLAYAVRQYDIPTHVANSLFHSYDVFLSMLNDEQTRERLETLRAEEASGDSVFGQVRDISRDFQTALDAIFFDSGSIGPLTKKYGVF